ncbi:MAG: TPM domain-containing protein [Candidatus Aminicenantes bacterium]|nr:TPM domain-containing protein [Candidatus Aminicenantes bacterium]
MRGKLFFVFGLLLWGIVILPLGAENVEQIVNPRQASGSYVSDNGGVLGPEYTRLIDAICRELKDKTTVELAVVTVGDLGGLVIDDFADKLFRRFAIGVAGKDNGLLLLYSRDDRTVRLEVGYGLEADIPDAKASRILDLSALPYIRNGLIGRGLFLAVRDLAQAASGGTMFVSEPASWPEQVKLPVPLLRSEEKKKKSWDPLLASLYFGIGLLALSALLLAWTVLRFDRSRGMAARAKVIGGAIAPTIIAWTGGLISFFLILGFGGKFLQPFLAMLAAPGLATGGQLLLSSFLKRRLASYRLPCPSCGQPMEMVPDSEDEKFLSTEEAAEEKAGGMDYEFWHCPKCGADEKLAVKLGKAAKCPQCGRRTLVSSTTTLVAATNEQGGKTRVTETCLNPKCGYSKTREHDTPRLSSPSSSGSSGASRSSSGSFGGGRSGGGGASKKF